MVKPPYILNYKYTKLFNIKENHIFSNPLSNILNILNCSANEKLKNPARHEMINLSSKVLLVTFNDIAIKDIIEHIKNPNIATNNLSSNFLSVFNSLRLSINLELGRAGIKEKLANKKLVAIDDIDKIPEITSV